MSDESSRDAVARRGRQEPDTPSARRGPILVGVGASSAAPRAIEALLGSLASPDWATILIPAPREALDATKLQEDVLHRGAPRIEVVEDGSAPEAGKVYLCGPDLIMTVRDGLFHTRQAEQSPGHRGTIDSFLVSLAEDQGERAIGVVLHGTGGDGTLGIATLKERGGLAIAEQGPDETADEVATGKLPAALADFVLPAQDISRRIASHVRRLGTIEEQHVPGEAREGSAAQSRIATILRNKTGHDFHGYKSGTFMRRVKRRMSVLEVDSVEDYLKRLRDDPGEVQNLFNDLLIGVTQFFRDRQEFDVLESRGVPRLFDGKGAGDPVRAWVLGCATGEEAYSLAILFREHMATLDEAPKIQIFATDIDVRALASARAGRYPKTIAADMTPERLARWFVKEGDTYVVVKELREMCIFSSHNVIKDAPFSRLDLISCRNLLIYLDNELQNSVIPLFHFALRPGGLLFLGSSENGTRHPKLFEPLERRSRIFLRLDSATRTIPDFPLTAVSSPRVSDLPRPPTLQSSASLLERRAERIVERFAPAYVIIDERFEILHFSGPVGPYLGPMSGVATLDLLKLVHRDLRADLRSAVRRATDQDGQVEVDGIQFQLQGREALVQLVVSPVRDRPEAARHFVVVFRDGAVRTPPGFVSLSGPGLPRDERIELLEADLASKGERLQTTIEELESTNEELTSSNEEYQSLNEELQSANEELETSKEELQSINEELNTVNAELGDRVLELTNTTSDLKNFLESTQIATLFLDNELKITTFTPSVRDIFHLIDADVGRPLSHIRSRIPVDELYRSIEKVLRTLSTVEHTVEDGTAQARYIVRVLPYRSVDNFIAGVVVTFTNVTLLARAEEALRLSEARFRAIFESAAEYAIITMDRERRVTAWSPGAARMTGWEPLEVLGQTADLIFTPDDREAGSPAREAAQADADGRAANERWHQRKDGSRFWGSGATTLLQDDGQVGYLKILTDRTEARTSEERQRVLLGELQHRVRNTLAVVRSIARRTADTSETVEDYTMHLDGRLNSFSRVQAAVTRDPTAGVDLGMLVAEELLGCGAHEGEQVNLDGPDLRLQPKAAETLGLAIHELATNALKHGALTCPAGRIAIRWRVSRHRSRPSLTFEWAETGLHLDLQAARRRGFGTELLDRTLAYELKGHTTIAFREDGVLCRIEIPITDRIVMPQPTA